MKGLVEFTIGPMSKRILVRPDCIVGVLEAGSDDLKARSWQRCRLFMDARRWEFDFDNAPPDTPGDDPRLVKVQVLVNQTYDEVVKRLTESWYFDPKLVTPLQEAP